MAGSRRSSVGTTAAICLCFEFFISGSFSIGVSSVSFGRSSLGLLRNAGPVIHLPRFFGGQSPAEVICWIEVSINVLPILLVPSGLDFRDTDSHECFHW